MYCQKQHKTIISFYSLGVLDSTIALIQKEHKEKLDKIEFDNAERYIYIQLPSSGYFPFSLKIFVAFFVTPTVIKRCDLRFVDCSSKRRPGVRRWRSSKTAWKQLRKYRFEKHFIYIYTQTSLSYIHYYYSFAIDGNKRTMQNWWVRCNDCMPSKQSLVTSNRIWNWWANRIRRCKPKYFDYNLNSKAPMAI